MFHIIQQEMKIYQAVYKMILTKELEIFQASINEQNSFQLSVSKLIFYNQINHQ